MFDGEMLEGSPMVCRFPDTFEYTTAENTSNSITATLLGVDGNNHAYYLAANTSATTSPDHPFHSLTQQSDSIVVRTDADGTIIEEATLGALEVAAAGTLIEGKEWYDLTDYGLIALACQTGFEIDHYPEFAEMEAQNTSRRDCKNAPESKHQLVAILENGVAIYYAPASHRVQAYAFDLGEQLVPLLDHFRDDLETDVTLTEYLDTLNADDTVPCVKERQPLPHPPRTGF